MSRASEFLLNEYHQRKKKNPRYSQAAFARRIGINSGRLTQYFLGKRIITKKAAQKISVKLELDSEQHDYFIYLCGVDKADARGRPPQLIKDDELALLVEWHHLAIMYLTLTETFKPDPAWIAQRLGLPKDLVISSLERLKRIGLVEVRGEKVEARRGSFITTTEVPNKYLLMSHKDMFKHMAATLSQVPVGRRDVSSITVAFDDKNLPKAKEMIKKFRRKLALMCSRGNSNQVYTINIQLYPLTNEV